MPQQVRGVVVDPAAPGRLSIKPVELRDPDRDEVAVRVTAISLNRGETRRAVQQAEPGWRPGWDFAGVAETAAADGSGPKPGTRVVGILPSGAWAERVNCRTHAVAALPDAVDDAEAATLPVAGLTALHALRQGGLLSGARCWSMAPRVESGISPASSLRRPARKSGAMCAGRNIAPPLPNGAANGSCSAANSSPPSRTGRSG
jgi:threonine dehydrogenase-like Zn-dependent dehydrogenase